MSLVLVSAPAAIVSRDEVKRHLRFEPDDAYADDYLDALIATATYHVDGPEGCIGRCIGEQTWLWTIDEFPAGGARLHIPLPPTVSVDEIEYDNTSNVATAYTGFRTLHAGAETGTYVVPAIDGVYPETNGEPGSVRVTFTAGYTTVPPTIKHAILLLISHWYEHRDAALDTGAKFGLLELPIGVQRLLSYHVFRHPTS